MPLKDDGSGLALTILCLLFLKNFSVNWVSGCSAKAIMQAIISIPSILMKVLALSALMLFLLASPASVSPAAALDEGKAAGKAGETQRKASETALVSARLDQMERKLELLTIKISRLSEATDRLSREVAALNPAKPSSPYRTPLAHSGGRRQSKAAGPRSERDPDAVRIRVLAFGIEQSVVFCDAVKCWSADL